MNSRALRLLPLLLAGAGSALADTAPAKDGPPASYPLSAYADVGSIFGENRQMGQLGWSEEQFHAFLDGLTDSFHGKPHPTNATAQALIGEIGHRLQQLAQQEAQARREFFKDPAHVEIFMKEVCKTYQLDRTDSGLGFTVVAPSSGGARPEPGDTVVVTLLARSADGKTELPMLALDKKPIKVAQMLPGLAEAVQMMTPGSRGMVVLPPSLSFGSGPWPEGIEPGTPLFFMLTLDQVIPGS